MIQVLTTTDRWNYEWHSIHRWDGSYRNTPQLRELNPVYVTA